MGHSKSSSSKGHGGGGKSHGSSSGSKKQYVEYQVWYCVSDGTIPAPSWVTHDELRLTRLCFQSSCDHGPHNPHIDAHCANCGHRRCTSCKTSTVRQRVDY
ncbi:hypothetical protein CNYM01_12150 [Colletotrichum nymphaeae SA-01]|uniref:Uncharacterized protein n=1 Tax=Colletotrichum nymphaeae SA-01 TaxID=1460502 RepID=A0A135TRC0_9PEZI|nr:hypothetical protein CNYM01_12150 [Colletotrichum nymphaeae SA-01]